MISIDDFTHNFIYADVIDWQCAEMGASSPIFKRSCNNSLSKNPLERWKNSLLCLENSVVVADLILIGHFCIVLFITFGLLILPFGYLFNLHWTRNRKLRLVHISLMGLITLEALVGITCPLTRIENSLRNVDHYETFISYWLKQVIYWEVPADFFSILYLTCSYWLLLFWFIHPPLKTQS